MADGASAKRPKARHSFFTRFFRRPGASFEPKRQNLLQLVNAIAPDTRVELEHCFYIASVEVLDEAGCARLKWLLAETFEPERTTEVSHFGGDPSPEALIIEVGPRMTFESAFSSNAVGICKAAGLSSVQRVERSRRFRIVREDGNPMPPAIREALCAALHDRMTETEYKSPLEAFDVDAVPEEVRTVDVMGRGEAALAEINEEKGLGFDAWDLAYYTKLFQSKLGRNPTDVECFDLGQSNSEHSRHWFFGAQMVIDEEAQPQTLFAMVKATLPKAGVPPEEHPANRHGVANSVIAFHDNSSALQGPAFPIPLLRPSQPGTPSPLILHEAPVHPILTAETHNFPCGVAPFPGAETGTGGRLRDVMATGRGAFPIAGISSYCVGNLLIPGHDLPWEDRTFQYAANLASPLDICIEASNGASDYGNKYGEPVVAGFCRSFGMRLPSGDRREWVKPIMFSAGVAQLEAAHADKGAPETGMVVVKAGGPCYRIGLGGGAASSKFSADEADEEERKKNAALDFNAVQRGDAAMENRLNRLVRACIESGRNPIISIHDQGAGGNGNVLKEIVEPLGAEYDVRKVLLGDESLSVLEIWGAEYQENNAFLVRSADVEMVRAMAARENCPVAMLGEVGSDGKVVLRDSKAPAPEGADDRRCVPVELPLELVLGKMPQKTFTDTTETVHSPPLSLDADVTESVALARVLSLLQVGSKRFLVNKVDRSVTGLVAQQPCVGPFQLPLADYGAVANSMFHHTGIVSTVGEQPIKGLLDPACQARLTVAEAVTNLMFAHVPVLGEVKCSANWMWAAKLPGECARMYACCEALAFALISVGIGVDGGKDSLSMAAQCPGEVVKSPGEVSVTVYGLCPDVRLNVTPDLKGGATGSNILLVQMPGGHGRMGLSGTSFAHVYGQLGSPLDVPDCSSEDLDVLRQCFGVTQGLLAQKRILAGHDVSDGGPLTALLEMAFGGGCGLDVRFTPFMGPTVQVLSGVTDTMATRLKTLFHEEPGFFVEVRAEDADSVVASYAAVGAVAECIGSTRTDRTVTLKVGDDVLFDAAELQPLYEAWESTSLALEPRQTSVSCAAAEAAYVRRGDKKGAQFALSFDVASTKPEILNLTSKPKIMVLRQEGSNGDRELAAAFLAGGLQPWDVTMSDLLTERMSLDERFRGVAFVGGFSFADVLDSAKGWAGSIRLNERVLAMFQGFRNRQDTFSLGVCNGCQLMALLGWVPGSEVSDGGFAPLADAVQPRFIENTSGRFESRFATVLIEENTNCALLKGMGGSRLGVWVAHGEGRMHFPEKAVEERVLSSHLAPLRYCDEEGLPTESYPENPNGSPHGIAALCSPCGRHLALMPHPERCFRTWQWPYMPQAWDLEEGPWIKLFQNAHAFCTEGED